MIKTFEVNIEKTQVIHCETMEELAQILVNVPTGIGPGRIRRVANVTVETQPRRHDAPMYVVVWKWYDYETRPATIESSQENLKKQHS